MIRRYKIPKTIIWVASLFLMFLLIFSLFRFTTVLAFKPAQLSFFDLLPTFSMGLQFDLRWISLILLPIVLFSLWQQFSPFYSARNKRIWTWYLVTVTFFVFLFFSADIGSFTYNQTRLDAGAMNFMEDPRISLQMMWQTYPLLWIVAGLCVTVALFRWMYQKSHWRVLSVTDGLKIPYSRKYFVVAAILLVLLIYGRFGSSPLSLRNSFVFKDSFKSYLAVNPLENFFTTLTLRKPEFNEHKARQYFPVLQKWMPLPEGNDFTYKRVAYPGSAALESRPNIVLVLCESFSMYKSSMSGNPLGATPFFDSIAQKGIFFERCFTPHFSTARGLFSLVTGIPDAQLYKFSTRNPMAIDQRTIINDFEGYDKHYFLGGDPDFNNFRGLLKNIEGLQWHTEGSFDLPKLNVWGISDKNLFLEANKIFTKSAKPFFSIIQTSDNHRPFMIPPGEAAFEKKDVAIDTLRKYGFNSVEEYNSFRYADFCFQKFMEAASAEKYFHNTIFVFVGDHGVAGNARAVYPGVWTDYRLTDEHVPLLFYAPYLLRSEKRSEVVSQIDVLPTIAGLVQEAYLNSTLGRDLLDPDKKNNYAFITNSAGTIGVVTDRYYFLKNLNFADEKLVPLYENDLPLSPAMADSLKKEYSELSSALFETARYLIMNNKR